MSSLLNKTRRLNKILQTGGADPVVFDDICKLLSEVLSCNVYIISRKGKVLGHTFSKDFECGIMKKYVYIIVVIWALLAGGITAYNENLLRKGEEILLKVLPVDPRDFLRGDYVSLSYEINTAPESSKLRGDVYVILNKNSDKTFGIKEITNKKPENTIFLRGEKHGRRITYKGIQQYFVKEGYGRELEKKLLQGGIAKVSVDRNGYARIKEVSAIE